MNKCPSCGYENNDGAEYCLNCNARLNKSRTPSDYDIYMRNQRNAELVQKEAAQKIKRVAIAIIAVFIAGFGIFAYRYQTAPSRAENLVCNYIQTHVSNVERIDVSTTFGSCLNNNYIRYNGFEIIGTVVINGNDILFTAQVDMNGIFDSGKITSIEIGFQEIYR